MKKFSKLFGRRRPAEGYHSRQYTRETSPDVHQLTSRRRTADVCARTAPKTGSNLVVVDDTHPPCDHCRAIDFPKLLDWHPGQPRPWISLSHALKDSSCPYCTFFQAMIGTVDGADTFTPYLRIRQAFERLGLSEKHPLGMSVLIEVSTKTKSLPWGYIVKAVDDEVATDLSDVDTDATIHVDGEGNHEDEKISHSQINGTAHEKDAFRHDLLSKDPPVSPIDDSTPVSGSPASDAAKMDIEIPPMQNELSDTAPPTIRGRPVPPLLNPALVQSWLRYCRNNHAEQPCARKEHFPSGIRLIDCVARRVVSFADTTDDCDKPDFVALSYVRDGLNAQSSDDWTFFPEQPPALIADAVSLTCTLGFRYLWVDQFCLPNPKQEPEAHQRQLNQIGNIFAWSSLSLIAITGENAYEGIPGVSIPREEQLSLRTDAGLFTTSLLRPDVEISASKWASRGLSYQESLFSRRRLVFTSSQVYFQCDNFHCHESISIPLQYCQDLTVGRVFPGAAHAQLRPGLLQQHIGEYMLKDFVSHEERVDAFRGVLHRYSQIDHAIDSFAGLPLFHAEEFGDSEAVTQTDRLAVALGWVPDKVPAPENYVDPHEFHDTLPSWTWISWRPRDTQSALNKTFHFNLTDDASSMAVDVRATPKLEAFFGFEDSSVQSWETEYESIRQNSERIRFLRLKTFCIEVPLRKNDDGITLDSPFAKKFNNVIEAWCRSLTDPIPNGEHQLTAVFISGRHWTGEEKGDATVLVCRATKWEPNGHLIRLGIMGISFQELVIEDNGEPRGHAVLKGIEVDPQREDSGIQVNGNTNGKANGNGKKSEWHGAGKKKNSIHHNNSSKKDEAEKQVTSDTTAKGKDIQLRLREVDIY
ncbi:hypothetical protein S40285_01570 [Stachybotrys chlorohalonatus IBT 40285]|uniref:Heterokaryon incompatibility domain-containing protein n=1 Tax=Stachybotrys chlorohalonatus (strain IBT 40285) TaxID=1283841 RepID=A0A084QWA9_STAC4|nr:hypothetical protein S40285_01570 [Stachybotrys chlorohalonata IBT 40285]